MASFDDGMGRLRVAAGHVVTAANAVAGAAGYITGPWDRFTRWLRSVMPHGLYARALLIVIMPLVVLQSIVAFLFVERQSSVVNFYLSSAVTREIATLIDVYKTFPPGANRTQLRRIAQDRLGLVVDFLPGTDLPPPGSTRSCRTRSASRSACRSGSTPSAAPRSWKSASSSTTPSCASSRRAPTPTIPIRWSS
jgi:hypothetical protein